MMKKPKKDRSTPVETGSSPSLSPRPTPPMTTVMPKGKLKNK